MSPCCQTRFFLFDWKHRYFHCTLAVLLNEMDLSLQLKTIYKLHIVTVAMANNYHYLMVTYETIE